MDDGLNIENNSLTECSCHGADHILTKESVKNISKLFGLEFKDLRDDIFIQGSPERCVERTVFEDIYSNLYVIENITTEMHNNKQKIANVLSYLNKQGLGRTPPYLKNKEGENIINYNGTLFQIIPYIEGVSLPRPDFLDDAWRGKVLAIYLIKLKEASKNLFDEVEEAKSNEAFSIKEYVYDITNTIKDHDMDYYLKVKPVVEYLKANLFNNLDEIKDAFQHGDYHPVNVIWGEHGINSVIDWEFCGLKKELYDAANLIGCIGIENPNALSGNLITEFVKTIKEAELIEAKAWDYMVDYIIANRFAWLSEWFRKKDIEMIDLEIVYMNILIQNKDKILNYWKRL